MNAAPIPPARDDPAVVCLGNLTTDDIVLPDGREQPGTLGGDALFSAFGAAHWSDRVRIVAPLGHGVPEAPLERLAAAGWDLRGFAHRDAPGIHNRIRYAPNGDRSVQLLSDPDDFLALSPTPGDIPPAWLDAEGFHIAAMELEAQERLAEALAPRGALLSLDPRLEYIAGNEGRLRALIARVDVFMPSHVEAAALLGHDDAVRAAAEFADLGPRIVVIKQGERGSLVFDRDAGRTTRVPAVPAVLVDATGAGDAYCGAFLAHLLASGDAAAAGFAGAASASLAVEAFGSLAMLEGSRAEVRARFDAAFRAIDGVRNG